MKFTRKSNPESESVVSLSRIVRLSILATLSLAFAGLFILPAKAQQPDAPDLIQTFPVGHNPQFLASDGANIWVTNKDDDTVAKLRASDGTLLGTFDVGLDPGWITFDGANIWVANSYSSNVTKLRASDGATLGIFPVGAY